MQPSDFPQYHQSIKDHSASREKLLAAVAHHKQHIWEKELAVTLEYRELHERWRTYYYSNALSSTSPTKSNRLVCHGQLRVQVRDLQAHNEALLVCKIT